jgi:hypothetical protein
VEKYSSAVIKKGRDAIAASFSLLGISVPERM